MTTECCVQDSIDSLDMTKNTNHFNALCSSSNTSSSSSDKVTSQPSESTTLNVCQTSPTFIPLSQSRPILDRPSRPNTESPDCSSVDSYETKSALSFSASNSVSSLSSSPRSGFSRSLSNSCGQSKHRRRPSLIV